MKKALVSLLALTLCVSMLAACGSNEKPSTPSSPSAPTEGPSKPAESTAPEESTAPTETAAPAEPKILKLAVSGEAACLNPHDSNSGGSMDFADRTGAGLYGQIPNEDGTANYLAPVLADGEPETIDGGKTWIIHLNKDAKWADGTPINANTVMYSWKMALDPILLWSSTSGLAKNYIEVENAMAYYKQASTGVEVKWEDVGFKALDEYTLQINCTDYYTAWDVKMNFYMRSTMVVKEDLYESCMNADRTSNDYGTTLEKTAFCGMFIITDWVKGAEATFVKNENYVHAERIKLDGMYVREVADESTRLELFEKGECDYIALGTNGLEQYGEDPRIAEYNTMTIRDLQFNYSNPEKPYLADPDFRKFIYWGVDRNVIAKLTNKTAAPFFFGVTNQGLSDGTLYRETPAAQALVPENGGYDLEKSNAYLQTVLDRYNLDHIELNLVYIESAEQTRLASEYIQSSFEKNTNGKVKFNLQAMQLNPSLEMMRATKKAESTEYDMCWSSMGLAAEVYLPWKRAERYTSTNNSGYADYGNKKIDELVAKCSEKEYRLDDAKLLALEVEIEQEMYDYMIAVPVIEEKSFVLFSDRCVPAMQRYVSGVGWGLNFIDLK